MFMIAQVIHIEYCIRHNIKEHNIYKYLCMNKYVYTCYEYIYWSVKFKLKMKN